MKPMKRRKNAMNLGNYLQPDNNHSRKNASAIAAHTVHCFGRKSYAVYDPERL